jgi:predicted peptidase
MHRLGLLLTVLVTGTGGIHAADTTGFLTRTYKGADGAAVKYTVFVPHQQEPGKKVPTILFLHGAGEIGDDAVKQARVGLGKAIREQEKTFPFLVVFPQAQKREPNLVQTWYPGHPEGDRALRILDAAMKEFNGDPQRLYLTGISMGGFGTWKMAQAFPRKWAAIAPICGGGDPTWADTIKNIPCWAFHGEKDSTVPADMSRKMIDALKKAGATPKYDEYSGVGHNSWDKAYATPGLFEWFLKHSISPP